MEQLALHGPVKDNQAVVATTSYPFHLAPVVDDNHSNLSSPSKTNTSRSRPTPAIRKIPGGGEARRFGGSPTNASCSGRQQPSWTVDSRGSTTRTVWENIQRLHIRTSPLPPSKDTSTNNPYHSTHFLFNLCCIISL